MSPVNARRVESPSSINTYNQCPRKYFYRYIARLPTTTSIHLVRGSVIHEVLEDFYLADLSDEKTRNFHFLSERLFSLFRRHWQAQKVSLESLGLSPNELTNYYDESLLMLKNWFSRISRRMTKRMEKGQTFVESFQAITPRREEKYVSQTLQVMGYVDAIHEVDGKVVVMDYKTSKKDEMTAEYRLQLAIYAALYEETHGRKPDFVGIDFLRSSERVLKVDDALIKDARVTVEQHHTLTTSDMVEDYQKRPSPLCKWRSGQCDYYEVCFEGMSHDELRKKRTNPS